jgi:serine protease Do/serine protease DegQ
LAKAFGIERNKGVVVARVEADSPAENAGMKVGDVIVKVNGKEAISSSHVRNEIGLLRIGSSVKIEVLRNGKLQTLSATVEDQITNSIKGVKLSKRLAGAELGEVREETSRGSISGIEVLSAKGKAASSGLRKGDIILSVNKQRVKSISDMQAAIKRNADATLLNIQRDSRGLFLLIR